MLRGIRCMSMAKSLKPFVSGVCGGCGADYQFERADFPGYLEPGLKSRLFVAERPQGPTPVLASEESRPKERRNGPTRIELERLAKRFGQQVQVEAEFFHEKSEPRPVEYSDLVCSRCHTLTYNGHRRYANAHEEGEGASGRLPMTEADAQLLAKCIGEKTLLVKIVDLIDWPYSAYDRIHALLPRQLRLPTLLVGNKIDLLPGHGSATIAQVTDALRSAHSGLNLVDTVLVSAKSGFNIGSLHRAVLEYAAREREHVLLVGRTNVGKSRIFNSFLNRAAPSTASTVSPIHGTTVGLLKKKLANVETSLPISIPRHLYLYDLPGFILPASELSGRPIDDTVTVKIHPIRHSLDPGEAGLIHDFCRIECKGAPIHYQLYMKDSLPYRRIFSAKQPSQLRPAVEFDIQPNPDTRLVSREAVLEGNFGWIAFGHSEGDQAAHVSILTPDGRGVQLRPQPFKRFFL